MSKSEKVVDQTGAAGKSAANKPVTIREPDRRRQELGRKGEELACTLLLRNGAEILERNWKCPAGEADIIAREDGELVFAEVKTRRNISSGFPEEAVTARKRARYERIALMYLANHDLPSSRVRFDVIAVTLISESKTMIRHHRDAFSAGV
ncbi:MAG: YraN family protein [Coriobacteriales bacterium]|jgi:putative endonuclease|nr:YraN family protein [Coriobacteriales bacterium]